MGSLSHVMSRETMSRLEKLSVSGSASAEFPITNYKFKDLEQVAVLGSGTFGRVTLVREKVRIYIYIIIQSNNNINTNTTTTSHQNKYMP